MEIFLWVKSGILKSWCDHAEYGVVGGCRIRNEEQDKEETQKSELTETYHNLRAFKSHFSYASPMSYATKGTRISLEKSIAHHLHLIIRSVQPQKSYMPVLPAPMHVEIIRTRKYCM
jgi:hypothetical protein